MYQSEEIILIGDEDDEKLFHEKIAPHYPGSIVSKEIFTTGEGTSGEDKLRIRFKKRLILITVLAEIAEDLMQKMTESGLKGIRTELEDIKLERKTRYSTDEILFLFEETQEE